MAGGTGGHVFPGLAVAALLQQQGHQVEWLGTQHGLDANLVPKANLPFHQISIRGLRGKGILGLCLAPLKIAKAIFESLRILRQVKPDVVLGLGGYVTGPGGIACWLKRIPLVIHEQNAIPGKTNQILTRFASSVLQAFPNSFAATINALTVGNPIREAICQLPPPEQRLNRLHDKLNILVFGGSQGAQAINHCVLDVLSTDFAQQHCQVWHQVGARNDQAIRQAYQARNLEAKVTAFIDDMPAAYDWADLVICRAGALSVSEIAAVGIACILIPFPSAVDDHQTANAQTLAQAGAAIIIQEQALNTGELLAILREFSDNRQQLIQMAMNGRRVAMPEATANVAKICLQEAS